MQIKHAKTSAKSDGVDPTLVQPSDWNAAHVITMALNNRVLGNNLGTNQPATELTASQILDMVSNTNGVLLTRTGGSWAAIGNVVTDNSDLVYKPSTVTQPAIAGCKEFCETVAGRNMLGAFPSNGASGVVSKYLLQPLLARKALVLWKPEANVNTIFNNSGNAISSQGTLTARAPASTNLATSSTRIGVVSAAGAGSVSQLRAPQNFIWLGNAAGLGGFFVAYRFVISDAVLVSTANMFAGIQPTAGATDVGPQTLTNLIGVGCTSGDTHLQLYAAGSAAQARTDLGANFPCNTVSVDVYELILFAAPNSTGLVNYQLTRLNTGNIASGTITAAAQLPSSTTFMVPSIWRSNGGTASAVGFDLCNMYCETDN